jgi:hypothetical protein
MKAWRDFDASIHPATQVNGFREPQVRGVFLLPSARAFRSFCSRAERTNRALPPATRQLVRPAKRGIHGAVSQPLPHRHQLTSPQSAPASLREAARIIKVPLPPTELFASMVGFGAPPRCTGNGRASTWRRSRQRHCSKPKMRTSPATGYRPGMQNDDILPQIVVT